MARLTYGRVAGPRKWVSFCAVGLALAAARLSALTAPQAQAPAESTSYIAVVDGQGHPVTGLTVDDFKIWVGEGEAHILAARPATDPIALAVILAPDRNETLLVQEALRAITTGLRQTKDSRAGLTKWEDFSVPFDTVGETADPLTATFNRRFPNPVDVLPGILGSAKSLMKEPTARRNVLALARSENEGILALTPPQQAGFVGALKQARTTLWGITIETTAGQSSHGQDLITEASKYSGGHISEILKGSALPTATRDLMAILGSQYAVTYERQTREGPDGLRVAVRRAGVTIFAPAWAY
jgi:hypothetical protein